MATDQSIQETIDQLLREVQTTRTALANGDDARSKTLTELRTKVAKMEAAIDGLSRRLGRPGGSDSGNTTERDEARALLELKHVIRQPKHDPGGAPFVADEPAIEEAMLAVKGMRHLLQTTDINSLPHDERKALTSFSVGASGFILPPEMSSQVLSCLEDKTDVAGLMQNITISGPSVKFLVDNAELDQAAWACDVDCWSASHVNNVAAGLSELEIKPETLRYIVCTSRDLLEDSSVNIEQWLLGKVNRAFQHTISAAVMTGDGVGKPMGILNPAAGIPICDTAAGTPAGQFTWQDLVSLKWQVPQQFHAGASFLMNQATFGLVLTMSDSMHRPIMLPMPTETGQFTINGSPVQIVSQMPDVAAGATPVAFGNWSQAYTVVNRKAVTVLQDPYSAGFCVLWKWEARVGGNITCPNAARLLRIR
jgi:HK97 family phage major capsid protein